MQDVLGQAIWDYHFTPLRKKLWIHNPYGPKEEMPVKTYFRRKTAMPELELTALHKCKGRVLDIGAGAGSHTLLLQEAGLDVTALDISPKATAVAKDRGARSVVTGDIFTYQAQQYHTLLLLMNGIGLCGTINRLRQLLQHAATLLYKGGQLIFDSSDIAYLYNYKPPASGDYYGEIQYQYEYNKQKSDFFKWLYIDAKTLKAIAKEEGWKTTILYKDDYDQYLALLTLA